MSRNCTLKSENMSESVQEGDIVTNYYSQLTGAGNMLDGLSNVAITDDLKCHSSVASLLKYDFSYRCIQQLTRYQRGLSFFPVPRLYII